MSMAELDRYLRDDANDDAFKARIDEAQDVGEIGSLRQPAMT